MQSIVGQSLFSKQIHPKIQAGLAFIGVIVFCGLGQIIGIENEKLIQQFPWMIAAAFMLVFAIFNSVFMISATNAPKYLSQSIIWYMILGIMSSLVAFTVTGLSPNEAGSIKSIFVILTMGYIVFLAIMGTIKFLIGFFNKEEEKKLSGKNRIKGKRKRRME